ncbi:MAG: hypothetical protein ACJ75H_19500 [Thermoanaerobaculia bacterium]
MSTQQSGKRGVVTDSQSNANTRHGDRPAPETAPDAGAHGNWKETPTTDQDSQNLIHPEAEKAGRRS